MLKAGESSGDIDHAAVPARSGLRTVPEGQVIQGIDQLASVVEEVPQGVLLC